MSAARIRRFILPAGICLSLAVPVEFVNAQLEEVIVTARKREEGFLDVPVTSVTIDRAGLEAYQTTSFFNLASRVPGLIVGNNVGSVGGNATIRGIGSTAFNPATDGAVAVNVDGIQFSHGGVLRTSFFDVRQVEVLKGPQALFFGKNSPGGIITIRTEDPGEEFEAMTRLGYETEAEKYLVEGILSGPLSDTVKARLAVAYNEQEGYFENEARPGAGLGGAGPKHSSFPNGDSIFARLTLLFDPSDQLSIRFKASYEDRDIDGDGGTAQVVGCDTDFDPIEKCVLDDKATIADLDLRAFPGTPNGGVPYQQTDLFFSTLEINASLSDALTLTSVTGYSDNSHEFNINGTFQPGTVDQTSAFLGFPGSVLVDAPNSHEQEYFTQEFRLATDFEGPLNGVVGLFYEDASQDFIHASKVPAFGVFNYNFQDIDIETFSVFGQLTVDISDTVELAGGLRYIEEERDLSTVDNGTFFGFPGVGPVALAVDNIDADDLLPEVTLNWQVRDNITLFAAYRSGWKSGSFNVDQPTADDRSYEPETAEGGEIGFKGMLLDNTLRVNASAYYYEYDDLQVSKTISIPGGTGTLLKVVNAATAEVSGVEVELTYAPAAVEGLTLHGAINYNRGEFEEFPDAPCYGGQLIAQGCARNFEPGANELAPGFALGGFTAQDLSGEDLPRSPEWTGSFGFDYQFALGAGDLMLGIAASTTYADEMWMNVTRNPRTLQDDYWKSSAALRLYPQDQNWELALIGSNLEDEITASTCFSGPFDQAAGLVPNPSGLPFNPILPGSYDNGLCFAEPGREIWLRFTVNM